MTTSETLSAAFEDLSWVRAFAARLAQGDADEADDLVQETLLVAWEQPPQQPVRSRRAWLSTVLRSRARMRDRSAIRREARNALAQPPQPTQEPGSQLERIGVLQVLLELLRALPDSDRAIVIGRFFDERTATEIGRELGLPPNTVRSRLKRTLERLRQKLDAHYEGDRAVWSMAVALPTAGGPGLPTITNPTGTAVMTQGIKLTAAATAAITLGIGLWAAQRDASSPPQAVAQAPESAPATPQPPTPAATKIANARGRWLVTRDRIRRAQRPSPAHDETVIAIEDEGEGYQPMLEEAQQAERDAWEECTDGRRFGKIGVVTMRTTILGAPDVGTIYESVDVLDALGNDADLLECLTSFMHDFVGTAPPHPFSKVTTITTLGQRPDELDDAQWQRKMFDGIMYAHLSEARACETEHGSDGGVRGAVTLDMRFGDDPAASEVELVASQVPDAVAECIADEARSWMFPRSFSDQTLSYTFTLPIDPAVDGIVEP